MRGAVCRWPFRAATDLLARRGAGENNKAVLPTRSRAKGTISARKNFTCTFNSQAKFSLRHTTRTTRRVGVCGAVWRVRRESTLLRRNADRTGACGSRAADTPRSRDRTRKTKIEMEFLIDTI